MKLHEARALMPENWILYLRASDLKWAVHAPIKHNVVPGTLEEVVLQVKNLVHSEGRKKLCPRCHRFIAVDVNGKFVEHRRFYDHYLCS